MVLCDNFYTPRVRPEVAWDLKQMVETIADFSVDTRRAVHLRQRFEFGNL